jgi:hypothetical protein
MATEAPTANGAPTGDYSAVWADKYRGVCILEHELHLVSLFVGDCRGPRPPACVVYSTLGPYIMGAHVRP